MSLADVHSQQTSGVHGAGTGELVTTTGTQTLTGKTLTSPTITAPTITDAVFAGTVVDSTFLITDNADPTKILAFQLSGITTGTTRTVTIPDASFTAVGLDTSQAITGKSINGLTITTSTGTLTVPNGVTLTGPAASGTAMTLGNAETITGVKTTAQAHVHQGAETHSGVETHSGDEVFSGSPTGIVVSKTITFTEDATSVTHTGTVVIPAGATLHDIIVTSTVLWTDSSAAISVGDAQAATGWFNTVNLSATDLLVGEALRASSPTSGWAGKPGAYLDATTGKWGQATATKAGPYYATAGSVIGVVNVTTPSGTAGRTFMTVTYSVGTVTAATVA
jgi:hypothetical protein